MGRKLAENEREVIAALMKVFNLFYEGGLKQDHAVLNRCPTSRMNLCPAIKMIRSYTNLPKRAVLDD